MTTTATPPRRVRAFPPRSADNGRLDFHSDSGILARPANSRRGIGVPKSSGGHTAITETRRFFYRPWHGTSLAGRVGSREARRFQNPVCQPARSRPPV